MPVVFAAIAPHGDVEPGSETERGLKELARRFDAAAPEAVVVFTPHGVHVEGAMAVVVAAKLEGSFGELELQAPVDRALAQEVGAAIAAAGIPVVAVSFGGNVAEESVMPMDWGTLVPVWWLGHGRVPVVAVSPARDLTPDAHVRAGEAVALAVGGRRVAVVASADHGHGHDADGPYGFDPASAEFDARVVEIVRENRLGDLLDLDPGFVAAAKADSWWQLLMLHGALGSGFAAELLSYEVPTYYGMLCGGFAPA
jgi:aromatic ring-opening dioxygenase LigB subunit